MPWQKPKAERHRAAALQRCQSGPRKTEFFSNLLEDEWLGMSGAVVFASHGEGAFDDALGLGGEMETFEFVFC